MALSLCVPFCQFSACAQNLKPAKKKQKLPPGDISNFDGGVFFDGDGGLGDHTCFQIAGHMTAPKFFDKMIRVDGKEGTQFLRGEEEQPVKEFPDKVTVTLLIHDQPCSVKLEDREKREYLTHEMMESMKLSMYWKNGTEMRPAEKPLRSVSAADPIKPFAASAAEELPKRYQFMYSFEIPSAGVPLTDSLVMVLRTPENRIAARVAARLN
jgi:hypothetical protein